MVTRRKFLSSVALAASVPPAPPGFNVLRSPKDAEHVASLRKVVAVHAGPAHPKPRAAAAAQASGVTALSIMVSGGVVTISWQYGVAPFVVERLEPGGQWEATGNATMERTVSVPALGPTAYFRIREAVPMPLAGEMKADGLHLTWSPPDL